MYTVISGTLRTSVRGLAEDGSRTTRDESRLRGEEPRLRSDDTRLRADDARVRSDEHRLRSDEARLRSDDSRSHDQRARVEESLRTGRLDQNYMMVRAQSRLQGLQGGDNDINDGIFFSYLVSF